MWIKDDLVPSELVRRGDILRNLKSIGNDMASTAEWRGGIEAAIGVVSVIEGVEAEPVVHARWRWGRNSMNQYGAWCTKCECGWEDKGDDFDRVQGLVITHKYCPHCGAHMDEEV